MKYTLHLIPLPNPLDLSAMGGMLNLEMSIHSKIVGVTADPTGVPSLILMLANMSVEDDSYIESIRKRIFTYMATDNTIDIEPKENFKHSIEYVGNFQVFEDNLIALNSKNEKRLVTYHVLEIKEEENLEAFIYS